MGLNVADIHPKYDELKGALWKRNSILIEILQK